MRNFTMAMVILGLFNTAPVWAVQISHQGTACVEKGNWGHTPMSEEWAVLGSELPTLSTSGAGFDIDSSMALRVSETTGELLECQVKDKTVPAPAYRSDDLPDFLVGQEQFTWDLVPQGRIHQVRCRTASGLPGDAFYQWRINCD